MLVYLVLPMDLLDAKRLHFIGWLDETISLAIAIQWMSKCFAPEMEAKVDGIIDQRFHVHV